LATEIYVCEDCVACGFTPCYETVQAAVDAAGHGDELVVYRGTYEDQHVVIKPKAADQFHLTIRGEDSAFRARLRWGGPVGQPQDTEEQAVVEIHNEKGTPDVCCDMQITLQDLDIVATNSFTSALAVISSVEDEDQECNTGIFLYGNLFKARRSGPFHAGGGAVWIGRRPVHGGICDATNFGECLVNQSPKWGIIRDNDFVTLAPTVLPPPPSLSDAMSAYHFFGLIEGNRFTSTGEGLHLGYCTLDGSPLTCVDTGAIGALDRTCVRHNLFYCNEQNGIHVTHGTVAKVNNNIFAGTWFQENGAATGIEIGPMAASIVAGCASDTCDPEFNNGGLPPVAAQVMFNTVDRNEGHGIGIDASANLSALVGNIVSRCEELPPKSDGDESVGIIVHKGTFDPLKVYPDYNVLWENWTDAGARSDYDPAGVWPVGLEGVHDRTHEDPKGTNPHFEGERSGTNVYSYLLQSTGSAICGKDLGDFDSRAIDLAPQGFDDSASPPGQGQSAGDAGAYGGPDNIWVNSDANNCPLEFGLPLFAECAQ